jgi:hypothetical protein
MNICLFVFGASALLVGPGLPIHEVSRSHTRTHHSRFDSSGRVLSSSQRPVPDNTQHSKQTSMFPVGFEPTISAGERKQTGSLNIYCRKEKSSRSNETHCTGATFLHVSHLRGNYTLLFFHVFILNMEMRCSSETLFFANRQDVS